MILDDDTDVGYVEDGTPCGPSMMCLDRKCLLIQALNMSSCPLDSKGKVCSGHGVSRHQCFSSNLYCLAASKFTVVRLPFQPFSFCACCQYLCTGYDNFQSILICIYTVWFYLCCLFYHWLFIFPTLSIPCQLEVEETDRVPKRTVDPTWTTSCHSE